MAENGLGGPVALVSDTGEFAGAELYVSVLAESLRERCRFIAFLGDNAADETRARLREAGADVRIIDGLRRRPAPVPVARLVRELRAARPALVHVNLSDQGDGLAALAAGLAASRPLLATLHLVLPNRAGFREFVSERALRRFELVIGVSHAVGRYLGTAGIAAVVVRNGLPPTPPAPDARSVLELDGTRLAIGGVGRLHEQKGWDVLCRAASLVRRERPEALFTVIGAGIERENLSELEECAEVRFVGYRERAAALIPAFDILAVPSRYEGLGLTPLEALYQGVPVVASNIDGLAEVLGDCALLVPPDDPKALAKAILRLAGDADLRADLAERGRRRARELFSADRMADQTYLVYQAVAGKDSDGMVTLRAMSAHEALDQPAGRQ
jgi:glycosyltransferase involved in cell wall biosynthesis